MPTVSYRAGSSGWLGPGIFRVVGQPHAAYTACSPGTDWRLGTYQFKWGGTGLIMSQFRFRVTVAQLQGSMDHGGAYREGS